MSGARPVTIWGMLRKGAAATMGLLLLNGCGGGFFPPLTTTTTSTGTSTTGDYVYVANATTGTIAGFSVATSTAGVASLTAVSGSPYALTAIPSALAVTPSNAFLYVAVVGAIYVYSINATTGALTIANSGGAAAISSLGVVSIDISPDGQWLFALAADGATINEYQITASTGALAVATGLQYVVAGGATVLPRMIKVAPNGAYIAVALGTGGDVLIPFTTSTGAMSTSYSQLATGNSLVSDNAVTIDSGSTYLYIARSGAVSGVAVYPILAGGALGNVTGSPFAAGSGTYALQIDSTGKYIYAANRTDGTISGYTIGTAGALTALSGSPYANSAGVTSLARDNTAKYILGASEGGSPDLTMYSFDATVAGKLDSAATVASGTDPAGSVMVAATH